MRPGSESEPAATSHECKAVTEQRDKATWIPANGGLTRLLTRRAKLGCVCWRKWYLELTIDFYTGRSNLSRGHVLAKVTFATVDTSPSRERKMAFFAVSAHGAAEDGVMGSGLP